MPSRILVVGHLGLYPNPSNTVTLFPPDFVDMYWKAPEMNFEYVQAFFSHTFFLLK